MAVNDDNVTKAFQQIRLLFDDSNGGVTSTKLIQASIALIPIIEDMVNEPARGEYKKSVLIAVLYIVVEKFAPVGQHAFFKTIIATTVSPAVDAAIDVARGRIDLHKTSKMCKGCIVV